MTAVKKTALTGVLAIAAAGLLLLSSVPRERRLKLYLEGGTDPATLRWAQDLIANPLAQLLDPEGHDHLVRALVTEARIESGLGSQGDELGAALDVAMATDAHQIAINRARIAGVITLGMLFFGSLLGLVLWLRDLQTGMWLLATTILGFTLFPIFVTFFLSIPLGLTSLALLVTAVATLGRQAMIATQPRGPELPSAILRRRRRRRRRRHRR